MRRLLALLAVFPGAALAQPWVLGDPTAMQVPQPPFLGAFGAMAPTACYVGLPPMSCQVPEPPATCVARDVFIADDWRAVGTRPIRQIDIWMVWGDDFSFWTNTFPGFPFPHGTWVLGVYEDLPGPAMGPGDLIWTRTFVPGTYTATQGPDANSAMWDPVWERPYYAPGDQVWQYTFEVVAQNAFVQQDGQDYWLAVINIDPDDNGTINSFDAFLPVGRRVSASSFGSPPMYSKQESALVLPSPPAGAVFFPMTVAIFSSAFVVSNPLDLCSGTPPCSAADLTAGAVPGVTCYGVPNGALNNEDFFYYLAQFAAQNLFIADTTTSAVPGTPGYGVPNGILNNEDFFYYLTLFAQGC